jgi:biopolymer transport protein ExbB
MMNHAEILNGDSNPGGAAQEAASTLWERFDTASALAGLRGLVEAGGPVVVILLGLSVFALTVMIAKTVQLRPAILRPRRRLARAAAAHAGGATREALRLFAATPGAVAEACALALEGRLHGQADAALRERVAVAARGSIARMRSHLRVLEVISQVAPLLGLLGTILGMIDVFRVLEGAGNVVNPSELAGGIWVALLTTATGLGVAIPASIALQWFDGIIEQEAHAIEAGVIAILSGSTGEAADRTAERTPVSPFARPQRLAGE